MSTPFAALSNLWGTASAYFLRTRSERKFCRKNREFWRNWRAGFPPPDRNRVLVTQLDNGAFMALNNAEIANCIAAVKGCTVVYCARKERDKTFLRWVRKSYGPALFESIEGLAGPHEKEIQEEAKQLFSTLTTPASVMDLCHNGVLIGDIVYDAAMRHGFWQASIWEVDERILKEIEICLRGIHSVQRLVGKYQVEAALFSHTVNSYEGILMRSFASRGIEVYQGQHRVRKHRSPAGWYLPHISKPPARLLEVLLTGRKAQVLAEAENYIARRMSGSIDHLDISRAFSSKKKTYDGSAKFCEAYGLDPAKPCVFVMLHAFNDFPHHFEKNSFLDYYRWFLYTLQQARQIDSVNWVFKQHPSARAYPDDANLPGIFSVVSERHVTFLDHAASFNSASLPAVAHAIITCIGTAAVEFIGHGVPAVVAGESWYTGLGICTEYYDVESYTNALRNIAGIEPPTAAQQELARIIMYLSSGDAESSWLSILPPYSHEQRGKAKAPKLLDYMMKHMDDPNHLEALRYLKDFVMNPASELYLAPDIYQCTRDLKL